MYVREWCPGERQTHTGAVRSVTSDVLTAASACCRLPQVKGEGLEELRVKGEGLEELQVKGEGLEELPLGQFWSMMTTREQSASGVVCEDDRDDGLLQTSRQMKNTLNPS